MNHINMNVEEFGECWQLNEKRKNTEKSVYVLSETPQKRNKKEIVKNDNQYLMSSEKLWTNNLDELKSFIDLNERRPIYNKGTEKVLGAWLGNQLRNRKVEKNIMFNEDIRGLWDSFIKDYQQYFISNEELWTNNLTELKKFIDLNKRRPAYNKDTEKILSVWLCNQLRNRKTEKYNMFNEDIKNTWDIFIKDYEQYFLSTEKLWTDKLTELKNFIYLNKRRPKQKKNTEKVLGMWLNHQIKNRKTEKNIMLNEDIKSTWDSFIKNYEQYFISNEELWNNNLIKLKTFIDLNERRPSEKKETEKVLEGWLSTQLRNRQAKKYNMSNEDIRNEWDTFIKDYKQFFISNEELWTNNLTKLKTFIDLNKQRPKNGGKKIEKVLSRWLYNQLKNRKTEKKSMLNEDIRSVWDSFIKDYKNIFN